MKASREVWWVPVMKKVHMDQQTCPEICRVCRVKLVYKYSTGTFNYKELKPSTKPLYKRISHVAYHVPSLTVYTIVAFYCILYSVSYDAM